jgi:hypothetical protein
LRRVGLRTAACGNFFGQFRDNLYLIAQVIPPLLIPKESILRFNLGCKQIFKSI